MKLVWIAIGLCLAFASVTANAGIKTGVQASDGSQVIPADFRGKVHFEGGFDATITQAALPPRNLSLNALARSATSGSSEREAGTLTVDLEFDGSRVTGRYTGSGKWGSGTLSGTRSDDRCDLYSNGGGHWTGQCDLRRFDATMIVAKGRVSANGRINLAATSSEVYAKSADAEKRASVSQPAPQPTATPKPRVASKPKAPLSPAKRSAWERLLACQMTKQDAKTFLAGQPKAERVGTSNAYYYDVGDSKIFGLKPLYVLTSLTRFDSITIVLGEAYEKVLAASKCAGKYSIHCEIVRAKDRHIMIMDANETDLKADGALVTCNFYEPVDFDNLGK